MFSNLLQVYVPGLDSSLVFLLNCVHACSLVNHDYSLNIRADQLGPLFSVIFSYFDD
jgi:hypothetical protein